MGQLYLIRHGQTLWNTQLRLQGHSDSPLTPLGERQAAAVREVLHKVPLAHVYTSTSGRAFHTAQIITAGRPVAVTGRDALKEIDLGRWEGRTKDEVRKKYPQAAGHFWDQPHLFQAHSTRGETYLEARQRLVDQVFQILELHQDQTIAIVSHGVAIQLILSHFEGLGIEDLRKRKFIHQGSLSLIEYDGQEGKILYENQMDHLAGLNPAEPVPQIV